MNFTETKNLFAHRQSDFPLAVLIDADNVHSKTLPGLLAAIAKLGDANVKRIYGDWTTPHLGHWKSMLLEHAIQPVQQFAYTSGKNATDSAMIIDAMDLLYTGPFLGFCLVSSDSDFTRLAVRIKESGKRVYGFGEKKTPQAFVAACDQFIYTEQCEAPVKTETEVNSEEKALEKKNRDAGLIALLRRAIKETSDSSGWARLSGVGKTIKQLDPDFNPKFYGYKKLSDLASATGLFELDKKGKQLMIRDRQTKKSISPA